MILLISSKYDITTDIVVKWLRFLNTKFLRLNTENCSSLTGFAISNDKIDLGINSLDISKIKAVWHRRGRLRHLPLKLNNLGRITNYLKKEEDSLIKSIENYLNKNVRYIGSYIKEVENYKIDYLLDAKDCQLKIPNSLITTSKEELYRFKNRFKKIITKDIRYPVNIKINENRISSVGTSLVDDKIIDSLNTNFAPIFVQEYIEKQFEIRIFFFEKSLYAMAIFSQNDKKTKTDYRNYNDEKPNRCVPFRLPKNITEKIMLFIDKTKLSTGSIDLIYSNKKEFVFLEVNPMGQFDWVSKNCNYYIEKEIALKLTQ